MIVVLVVVRVGAGVLEAGALEAKTVIRER